MATFYDLVIGHWGARFRGRSMPCAIGRGGIGKKSGEGDGITPVGRYRIEHVIVRRDRVGFSGLVARIDARWSDDPEDPLYNRIRPNVRKEYSSEALRRADGLYDLIAVLDYNRSPVEPGRGSAIFLHVWRGPRVPTAGCVAFRRDDLAWILAGWTDRSRVVIKG